LTVTVCLCVYACFKVVHSQVPANGPFDLNNEPFDIDDDNLDRTLLLLNEGRQESTPGNGVCLAVGVLLGLSVPIRSSAGSMMSIGQMMGMNVMNAMSSMMTGTAVTPVMPTVCPDPVVCPSPVSGMYYELQYNLLCLQYVLAQSHVYPQYQYQLVNSDGLYEEHAVISLVVTQLSWTAAQSSCQAMGGRLAELETTEEINAVKSVTSIQNRNSKHFFYILIVDKPWHERNQIAL
ncbi:Hypothetical predicted protein, partial [Mytilus galloprovincialis]